MLVAKKKVSNAQLYGYKGNIYVTHIKEKKQEHKILDRKRVKGSSAAVSPRCKRRKKKKNETERNKRTK